MTPAAEILAAHGILRRGVAWPVDFLSIPGDWIVQGGAVGLLGLVVLLILTGWLVPRRTVRDIEKERNLWRTVALKSMGHTDALLPAAQIATQVTRALSDAAAPEKTPSPASGGPS